MVPQGFTNSQRFVDSIVKCSVLLARIFLQKRMKR